MYESETGFLLVTNVDTNMSWASLKHRFRIEDNGVVRASWDDDKD